MTDISATSFFRQAEAAPHGIHRGIDVRLNPEDHAIVHDESRPLHERAQHLIDTVTREGYESLGQHWSTDRGTAEDFAHYHGPMRDPQRTKVVFHADHPDDDEVEHDPGWREEHEVNDLEDEVPLKRGADVNVHSISWQRGDQHGKPWTRHTFNEEQWHTATLQRTASAQTWHTVRHYDAESLSRKSLGRDGIRHYADHAEAQAHADQITAREGLPPVKIVGTTHPDQSGYVPSHPHAGGGAILGLGRNSLEEGILIHELTHHRVHHLGEPRQDHHDDAFADHLGQMLDTHHSNPRAGGAFRDALQHTDHQMTTNPGGTSITFGTPYPPRPAPADTRQRTRIPLKQPARPAPTDDRQRGTIQLKRSSLTDAFRTASAHLPDGLNCIYPHDTGLTVTAGEYPDPPKDHDYTAQSWTQRRQYGAEHRAQYLLPEHKISSPEEAQELADKVTKTSGIRRVTVSHDPTYNYSFHQSHPHYGGRDRIVLGNGGMDQMTLLHELAHHVDREQDTFDRHEPHGASFHDHFNHVLRTHHPQGQMAEYAHRARFHETDQAMRQGYSAYLTHDMPNPEMTDRERALQPPEKPRPLWGDEKHDPETLDLASEAHISGNHYLDHMSEYPRLDPKKGPIGDQVTARNTDKALSQGVSLNLIKPSHVRNWLHHHPDLDGIKRRFMEANGYDNYDQMQHEIYGGPPPQHHATLRRTAAVEEGDDVPSRLLNPHGHHIRAKVGNHRNVEMVPRDEIARYASQETDPQHAKEVGHHLATSGEMEPLLLHYHPASGEAYLGEGNHRLRAAGPLKMDHLPVRVQRNNYGLPGPGVKVPQDHPNLATGQHIPHDIKPSDIGLTTVDKPTMSEWDKKTELAKYRLLHGSKTATAERPEWADGDFTAKSGHTYHTVTEPKCVTMRTPEGRLAGWVNWGDDGVIGNMNVREQHQRRGIATELLRRAREIRPDIQHSDRLSNDAQAWLKGIGERTASAEVPPPESYARQEGENWSDHKNRVIHGLSMGHLTTEQAEGTGGYKYVHGGWNPLPQELYHTTTDAAGVAAHGLKTGRDLGQRRGHGLGGSPQYLSLTDSPAHAHAMLQHLHEYHDVVSGKTSIKDMYEAARRGDGAREPFHERLETEFGKKDLHHALKGQRYSHSVLTDETAQEFGYKPSDDHERVKDWQGNDAGKGWVKGLTPEEEKEHTQRLYDRFSYARSKHGGPNYVFFSSNDHEAFAKKNPNNFAVLHVRPKPGAQGFENRGEHEWRTGTGDAVQVHGEPIRRQAFITPVPDNHEPYQHKHPWLPRDHFFAPGEKGLDPRLFDENDRMHPEVRQQILSLLNAFWAPRYGDSWQSWARVYLAGSEASHFYGNSDLDILIGIDHDALNHHVDTFTGEPPAVVDEKLTDELRHGLNDDARMLPGPDGKDTGPWENTWYVNPSSYDIRDIKPYAAYDITRDEWAVKPVEVPDDFGPEKLPESTWDVFEAIEKLISAVSQLPDGVREREGAALYDYLHADRHSAFGPEGSGLYDPSNAVWKALDKAPGKPLQQLIDWKHAHDQTAATDQEKAA